MRKARGWTKHAVTQRAPGSVSGWVNHAVAGRTSGYGIGRWNRSFWLYKPILYVLLFLLADKALLIPAIRQRFTLASDVEMPIESATNDPNLHRLRSEDRYHVWVFGTSRSMTLGRLTQDGPLPSVPKSQGRPLVVHSWAIAGSVPAVYLHQYLHLRSRGLRPDVVWIEIAPYAMNRNYSLRDAFLFESASNRFMLAHLRQYPPSLIAVWLQGRLLYGSVYPPGIYDERSRNLMRILNPLVWQDRTDLPTLSSEQLWQRHQDVAYRQYFREVYLKGHLAEYEIDDVALQSLTTLTDDLRREGIPYATWNPRVHESIEELYTEAGVTAALAAALGTGGSNGPDGTIATDAVWPTAARDDLHFAPDVSRDCAGFRDESHLAVDCFPRIAQRLMDVSH